MLISRMSFKGSLIALKAFFLKKSVPQWNQVCVFRTVTSAGFQNDLKHSQWYRIFFQKLEPSPSQDIFDV